MRGGKSSGMRGKGKRAPGKGRGKGSKNSLDFLDADDGGYFGLLQHVAPTDLKNKKWNNVDMGDLIPEGVVGFDDISGIESLDPSEYPALPLATSKKRKVTATNDEKRAKKKLKQDKKNAERKAKKKAEKAEKSEQGEQGEEDEKDEKGEGSEKSADESDKSTNNIQVKPKQESNKQSNKKNKTKTTTESKQSGLEPSQIESESVDMNESMDMMDKVDMSAWKSFRLHPKLMSALCQMGYTSPTEIQKSAIPVALASKDVVAAAETGSGKTLAFGLPILHKILYEKEKNPTEGMTRKGPLAVIISPTRELATQIVDHLQAASKFTTIKEISIVPIIGGMSLPKQERLLSYKPDIIVATPGRLWDLFESGNDYINNIDNAKWIVLDEADRLIQGNHFKEMDMLFDKLQMKQSQTYDEKKRLQILLFSATLIDQNIQINKPKTQKKDGPTSSIAKLFSTIKFRNQVESIDITKTQLTVSQLREAKIFCEDQEKDAYVYYLLQRYHGKTIVFVNSIHGVKRLTSLLRVLRVQAFPLFSDMEQRMRLKNLDRFKSTEHSVLVATDVAARGLDIPNIDHVIHFQIPLNAETYVHRSGRTARASRDGIAVMLINPSDQKNFIKIFKVLNKDTTAVPDFPVDPFFMPAIRTRLELAHQIELANHRSKKVSTEKQWLVKNLEISGGDVKEYFPDSDDEDNNSITNKRLKKRAEANVGSMQLELNELLSKPLLPTGINRNYVTATHFSTKLLVDPTAFHSSSAIQDLEDPSEEPEEDLGIDVKALKRQGPKKFRARFAGSDSFKKRK